jgi:prepilin peptidase CpaA
LVIDKATGRAHNDRQSPPDQVEQSLYFIFTFSRIGDVFPRCEEQGKEVRRKIRILLLCLFLFGAGWTDLRYGKVRNLWMCAGALAGITMNGREFLYAALMLLVPSDFLFRMRLMGAGDGKLMALIAGYLGIDAGLKAIAAGLAIGAVWSVCRVWHEKSFHTRFTFLTAYIRQIIHVRKITEYRNIAGKQGKNTIPLAVCLMAGTYVYLLASGAVMIGKELF